MKYKACAWSGDVSQMGYDHSPTITRRARAGEIILCPGCKKPVKLRQALNGRYGFTQIPRHKKQGEA